MIVMGPWSHGAWAFEPGNNLEGGLLDLRSMNEELAGENGFIRLSGDGNSYVRGDGKPIRLWGVACAVNQKSTPEQAATHARFLARIGVNAVRVGGASAGLIPQEEGQAITDVNEAELNAIWLAVASMKKEGIYTRISPFWDHGSVKYIDPEWGIEGYKSGDHLNALLFFEPTLQKGYKAWMKALLTRPNPHTGIPIKDDPAVAIIQIVSEDSMMFWWINSIKGGPLLLLQEKFGDFLKKKYGTLEKASEAWDGASTKGDDFEQGRVGLYNLHHLNEWPPAQNTVRLNDQTAFLLYVEQSFYRDMKSYLQDELGSKQLIGPSNFGPADKVRMLDLQRFSWTAGDVIEQNGFYSTKSKGPNAFWSIEAGHTFNPRSALLDPQMPILRKHVVGKPFNLSSVTWTPPNLYTIEGPTLGAAYGSLGGIDAFYWFAAQTPAYDTNPYFRFKKVQGSHPMKRWTISHPGFISQFPAAALIYRNALVDMTQPVIHEERTLESMIKRESPLTLEDTSYNPGEHANENTETDPTFFEKVNAKAYLAGRVEVKYHGDPAKSEVMDLSPYIDDENQTVKSINDQLFMDNKHGVFLMKAPATQGVVGFLKNAGGIFETPDMTVKSSNHYASIIAVAMDGQPLESSKKILVQCGTIARPTGWTAEPSDKPGRVKITNTGDMPWRMLNLDATLTIKNPGITSATQLDVMGFKKAELEFEKSSEAVELTIPADTLYLLLEAK